MSTKKLWPLIKEIEENKGLKDYYLHLEYDTGKLGLNIAFNNKIADEALKSSGIKIINSCAYWE